MMNLYTWMLANDFADRYWENENNVSIGQLIRGFNIREALELFPIVTIDVEDESDLNGHTEPDIQWYLVHEANDDDIIPYYVVGYIGDRYITGLWLYERELISRKPPAKVLQYSITDNPSYIQNTHKFPFGLKFKNPDKKKSSIDLEADKPLMICGLDKNDILNSHPGTPYCLDNDSSALDSKHDTLSWDRNHYWMTTRSKKSAKKKWGNSFIYISGVTIKC